MWNSVIDSQGISDKEVAKARAIGELQNHSMEYQRAEAKAEGDYRIHPGMRITLKYVGDRFSGEYVTERVTHEFSKEGFTTEVELKRNMASGEVKRFSKIDEEVFNTELKIDKSKWIAQSGISDVLINSPNFMNKEDYSVLRMGGHKLSFSEIFDYLKIVVENNNLMGKPYSTNNKNFYVCTTFVDEVLSLINASKSDYLPGGQKVVSSIAKLSNLAESNGVNPKNGTYVFYYDYGNDTGHTGFVKFDNEGNAEILHNGKDENGIECVNLYKRDSRDLKTWFSKNGSGKLYYKKLEVDVWIE